MMNASYATYVLCGYGNLNFSGQIAGDDRSPDTRSTYSSLTVDALRSRYFFYPASIVILISELKQVEPHYHVLVYMRIFARRERFPTGKV